MKNLIEISISMFWVIILVLTYAYRDVHNEYKQNVGKEVEINDSTKCKIIDFDVFEGTYILSNNQEVSEFYFDELK